MPQHRETASSVSVSELLGKCTAARSTRRRAELRTSDRVKLAATAAMAAGLVGTGAQLAHATVLPSDEHTADSADDITLKSAAVPTPAVDQSAKAHLPIVPEVASAPPQAAVVASATTPALLRQPDAARSAQQDPAPFGLKNLPPEVAGPLAQAEHVIKVLQLVTPGQQADPANAGADSTGGGAVLPGAPVLQTTSWGAEK
ncbi:hypothetical protein [Nocardia alni]|uniref:hypothetical protein n=1 Tax=Nocardia alni TaxID=2815723 RepID=UPI001C23E54E|nr:hypothetical protein [Nocardia alni]